ncbi:MAG: hypothetical protein OXG44_01365 [Gammaproteobacteria bacterium]|nr:hypothetical protein [Gammaproteobacteria bacterium]
MRDFMYWPARYLWIAAEGSRIDAEAMQAAKRDAGSLSSRLQQRERGGGVVALPLFPENE